MTMLLKIGLGIVALFAVLGLAVAAIPSPSPSPTPTIESTPEPTPEITQEATPEASPQVEGIQVSGTQATVARVIDGDTIELSTGERVRYIGVDTPETVDPRTAPQCLGKEASNKNKELVEGKAVTLEKDVSETDRYGRLLRYVYVDGKMINEALVAEGFAKASSYPPDVKHQEKFRAAEQSARNNKWGLWSDVCSSGVPASQSVAPVTSKAPAATKSTPAPTKAPTNAPTKPAPNCSSNSYNCTDFSTCSEAKAVYNACSTDIHQLDADDDGIPCDTLCQ